MATAAYKTGAWASWGITPAIISWANSTGVQGATIGGTCTDFSANANLQGQDEPNEYGTTIGRVVTDEIVEATATILVDKNATLPSDASALSVSIGSGSGSTFLVSSISDIQSNQQFRKIQMKLFRARYITSTNQQWNPETQT